LVKKYTIEDYWNKRGIKIIKSEWEKALENLQYVEFNPMLHKCKGITEKHKLCKFMIKIKEEIMRISQESIRKQKEELESRHDRCMKIFEVCDNSLDFLTGAKTDRHIEGRFNLLYGNTETKEQTITELWNRGHNFKTIVNTNKLNLTADQKAHVILLDDKIYVLITGLTNKIYLKEG
jgi:hypothetical protein